MNADDSGLNRRDRLRAQTLDEVERVALAIIDADGAHALSMAAVAKAMRMSAPGLYRYFASRDALVARLVTAAYGQLASAVERAAVDAAQGTPQVRIQAVAAGYRDWALTYPRRYRMLFGERPDDVPDTPEAIAAISRAMEVLVMALLDLQTPAAELARDSKLDTQLRRWARAHDHADATSRTSRAAILIWTRVHGVVSLELAGVFQNMELDARSIVSMEVDRALESL